MSSGPHPAYNFAQNMETFLWPKQIPSAFNWFKRKFGHIKECDSFISELLRLSTLLNEDAPTNAGGGSAIAGMGSNPPIMTRKSEKAKILRRLLKNMGCTTKTR
jgi:hypothetical protein